MFFNLAIFTVLAILCLYLCLRCYRLKSALETPLHLCELALQSVDAYIVLAASDFSVVKTNYYALTGTSAGATPQKLGNLLHCKNSDDAGECGRHELCIKCPIRAAVGSAFTEKEGFSGLEAPLVLYTGDDLTQELHCEVSVSGKYFVMDNKEYMLLTIYDLTRQKQIQRELDEARLRAEDANRMKSAFLANTTHEIRTPLNAILGFSDLLVSDADPEHREEYARIIRANNETLLQLVNDILDLSQIEAGLMEFDYTEEQLDVVMEELEGIFRMKLSGDAVSIEYRKDAESCRILTDRKRLTQVMMNFLSNAVRFTFEGSVVFGYHVRNGEIYFYVTDTGIGIPSKDLDRVFQRFTKLNEGNSGSGVGLSICKSIVEHMGGRIGVESCEGRGSTFWFTLPTTPLG